MQELHASSLPFHACFDSGTDDFCAWVVEVTPPRNLLHESNVGQFYYISSGKNCGLYTLKLSPLVTTSGWPFCCSLPCEDPFWINPARESECFIQHLETLFLFTPCLLSRWNFGRLWGQKPCLMKLMYVFFPCFSIDSDRKKKLNPPLNDRKAMENHGQPIGRPILSL